MTPLAYRVPDAAKALGLGKSTVWKLISEGKLPAKKLMNGATVIRHEDLVTYLNACPNAPALKAASDLCR